MSNWQAPARTGTETNPAGQQGAHGGGRARAFLLGGAPCGAPCTGVRWGGTAAWLRGFMVRPTAVCPVAELGVVSPTVFTTAKSSAALVLQLGSGFVVVCANPDAKARARMRDTLRRGPQFLCGVTFLTGVSCENKTAFASAPSKERTPSPAWSFGVALRWEFIIHRGGLSTERTTAVRK